MRQDVPLITMIAYGDAATNGAAAVAAPCGSTTEGRRVNDFYQTLSMICYSTTSVVQTKSSRVAYAYDDSLLADV